MIKKTVVCPFTVWVMMLSGHQTTSCNATTIWGHHSQLQIQTVSFCEVAIEPRTLTILIFVVFICLFIPLQIPSDADITFQQCIFPVFHWIKCHQMTTYALLLPFGFLTALNRDSIWLRNHFALAPCYFNIFFCHLTRLKIKSVNGKPVISLYFSVNHLNCDSATLQSWQVKLI